jgi:hypothetical protein
VRRLDNSLIRARFFGPFPNGQVARVGIGITLAPMRSLISSTVVMFCMVLSGCATTELAEKLQPDALRVAQQRGATDLGCSGAQELQCPGVTTEVTHKDTIEESQTTGWYDLPYRALYAITAAGCGKEATYLVACNNKEKRCTPSKQLPGS